MLINFFRTENYPSNLTELIIITSDEVHLLFDSMDQHNSSNNEKKKPLTLHFPANQRFNNGQWNNLILSWNSIMGEYSLIWNSVRIYSEKNYAVNFTFDIK